MIKTYCDLCGKEMNLKALSKFHKDPNGTHYIKNMVQCGTKLVLRVSLNGTEDICPNCIIRYCNDVIQNVLNPQASNPDSG